MYLLSIMEATYCGDVSGVIGNAIRLQDGFFHVRMLDDFDYAVNVNPLLPS